MALLETRGLTAFYGDFQALFGIDLSVEAGETIAIIGSNGAGKSTFLRTLTGLATTRPEHIHFDGKSIGGLSAPTIVSRGIAMVPEGRRILDARQDLSAFPGSCRAPPEPKHCPLRRPAANGRHRTGAHVQSATLAL